MVIPEMVVGFLSADETVCAGRTDKSLVWQKLSVKLT
jgi:hypothetical protein